jgi:hypothetical protein
MDSHTVGYLHYTKVMEYFGNVVLFVIQICGIAQFNGYLGGNDQ